MVWQQLPEPHTLASDVAIKRPSLNIIYDRNIAEETCWIIDFIYLLFIYLLFIYSGESCDQTGSL